MHNDPWKVADERRFQFRLWHLFVGTLAVAAVLGIARWSVAVAVLVLVDLFLVAAMVIQIRAGRRYSRRVANLPVPADRAALGCLRLLFFATGALLVVCSAATVGVIRQMW